MFVKTHTSAIIGIDAVTITVEADVSTGVGMSLVGLADNAVRESQERIRSAFGNSGYRMTGKKLVVNLAPADIRKEGAGYDLPIALAILAASGQISGSMLEGFIITGELSLDGSIKPVKGVLPMAVSAARNGFRGMIVPEENIAEAILVPGLEIYGVGSLKDAVDTVECRRPPCDSRCCRETEIINSANYEIDLSEVKGQSHVKRAIEIAAAGGHNMLMIGSPGSGKTMIASRIPTIMPEMTMTEAIETTKIHSVAGKLGVDNGLVARRPFRTPHHLTSRVALIGGGTNPQPGEISLAHNGVLFMDELPEFGRTTLEVLRQPLEDRRITVSRAKYTVEYPANFILIASMNPCPCGYYGHPTRECVCSQGEVAKYMNRISGPLMDRIDIHIHVPPVPFTDLGSIIPAESSADVRERVKKARMIQQRRFAEHENIHNNAMMSGKTLREFCPLSEDVAALLERAMTRLDLSARAYDRIIKLARTIADIESSDIIATQHIAEAINYRTLDRTL